MDFPELISDFAGRRGIADLAAEDNAAVLDIDDVVVTLVATVNIYTLESHPFHA